MQETERQKSRPPLIALLIATGFGSGFSPRAPGTAGSLVGAFLIWGVHSLAPTLVVPLFIALLLAGWWASKTWSLYRGQSDCQEIVIDEILGLFVAFLLAGQTLQLLPQLFILFRLFDVSKPWPIRRLDLWGKKLPLGWLQGGMVIVDDLLAGILAGIGGVLYHQFIVTAM